MITAIDPDLRKSGICTLDENGKIITLQSMTIIELIDYAKANPEHIYAIEDVNKIGAMYSRNVKNARVSSNIAQKVGMVKGAAVLIEQLIDSITGKPPILAPVGLGNQIKKDAVMFKKVSGWKTKSNEDMRDAWAIARWVYTTKEKVML